MMALLNAAHIIPGFYSAATAVKSSALAERQSQRFNSLGLNKLLHHRRSGLQLRISETGRSEGRAARKTAK
jgi:hypothetical protein